MARGIFKFSETSTPVNICCQNPNSSEGRNVARAMTSTSMMVIIGLLEKISASKAATEKKVKDQKESLQKAGLILYPYARTC